MAQAAAPAGPGGSFGFLGMMVLMFVIFYFLLIRPQQQAAKRHKELVMGSSAATPSSCPMA